MSDAPQAIAFWDIDGDYFFHIYSDMGETKAIDVAADAVGSWLKEFIGRHDLVGHPELTDVVKALLKNDVNEALQEWNIRQPWDGHSYYLHAYQPEKVDDWTASFYNPKEF